MKREPDNGIEYTFRPELMQIELLGLDWASFKLWIPNSIGKNDVIRGIIAVSDFDGARHIYFDPRWRNFAEKLGLGVLFHRLTRPVAKFRLARDENGLEAIFNALEHFASISHHPELKNSALIYVGISEAGFQAFEFSRIAPERTIGAIPIHGPCPIQDLEKWRENGPKVPQLHIMCEIDKYTPSARIKLAAMRARSVGALWTMCYQAQVKHDEVGNPDFMLKWLEEIVNLRLPEIVSIDKPTQLNLISEEDGYLGIFNLDYENRIENGESGIYYYPYNEFPGNKSEAYWIPGESIAKVWREYSLREDNRDPNPIRPEADYIVAQSDPLARDEGPGSFESPFKTISKAAKVAMPGDIIMVREGIYREWVKPARGGEEGKPIIYMAEDGEEVRVRGSEIWQPDWEKIKENVYFGKLDSEMFDNYNPYVIGVICFQDKDNSDIGTDKQMRPVEEGQPLEATRGQVFVDGKCLIQVESMPDLYNIPGSWIVNAAGDGIYIHFPPDSAGRQPGQCLVELPLRHHIFAPLEKGLEHIQVKGFIFEHYLKFPELAD